MGDAHASISRNAVFGETNRAGSIPDSLSPSTGPTYLEGRLVLSLSFQTNEKDNFDGRLKSLTTQNDAAALEHLALWDDLAGDWFASDLVLVRYEDRDVIARRDDPDEELWSGSLDTHARVILVPDVDSAGFETNQQHDLCWKSMQLLDALR